MKHAASFSLQPARSGLLVAFAAAFVLAGCASGVKLDDAKAPVEDRTATPVGNAASSAGTGGGSVATVDLTKQQGAAQLSAAERTVYFDYDSYVVKDQYRGVIENNAKALTANRQAKATVEGHTDERGGSEYNLALGQKRAEAVVKALTLLGVNAAQVEAVSFGKERPAVQGSDEEAWAKNRRAEIMRR